MELVSSVQIFKSQPKLFENMNKFIEFQTKNNKNDKLLMKLHIALDQLKHEYFGVNADMEDGSVLFVDKEEDETTDDKRDDVEMLTKIGAFKDGHFRGWIIEKMKPRSR